MQTGPDFDEIKAAYEREKDAFSQFEEMLLFYNARFNLTAVTDHEEIVIKHFFDSLAGAFLFPEGTMSVEIGSGAGFPSVPLMIARRDLRFTLVESTGKKCMFLREVIGALSLPAEVVCRRAEDAGKDPAFREKFSCATARAVAKLPTLAEYLFPFVRRGGTMIAYKGSESELESAGRAIGLLGGGKGTALSYALPGGYGNRTLVTVAKERSTPDRYPRGNGAERRAPL